MPCFHIQILFLLYIFMAVTSRILDNVCDNAFGLENGRIKDHQISASSYIENLYIFGSGTYSTKAKYGRLNGELAWCGKKPKRRSRNQLSSYFQVDFGRTVKINGIATQGLKRVFSYYVKSYAVRFSLNGNHWFDYSTPNKAWRGNTDSSSIRRVSFNKPVIANYLRIYPLTYNNHICLRAEVYGCYVNETGNSTQSRNTSPVQPSHPVSTTSHPTMKETHITKPVTEIFSKPFEYISPGASVSWNTTVQNEPIEIIMTQELVSSSRPLVINSALPTGGLASTVSHREEPKSSRRPLVINSTLPTGDLTSTVSHREEPKSSRRPLIINSTSPRNVLPKQSVVQHVDGRTGIMKINIIILMLTIGFILLCLLSFVIFSIRRRQQRTEIYHSEFLVLSSVHAVQDDNYAGKIPESV